MQKRKQNNVGFWNLITTLYSSGDILSQQKKLSMALFGETSMFNNLNSRITREENHTE